MRNLTRILRQSTLESLMSRILKTKIWMCTVNRCAAALIHRTYPPRIAFEQYIIMVHYQALQSGVSSYRVRRGGSVSPWRSPRNGDCDTELVTEDGVRLQSRVYINSTKSPARCNAIGLTQVSIGSSASVAVVSR